MAYASTITVQEAGSGFYVVTISETEAAAASEVEIDLSAQGLPAVGAVVARRCAVFSGTATTVQPVLGIVTDPDNGSAWLFSTDTAANPVHQQPAAAVTYGTGVSSFFHRSKVDAGADNSVTTVYHFRRGW
jgi:hypothetical protein